MKRMFRILTLLLTFSVMLSLAACSKQSSLSYTFGVDNGDNITIELDTNKGYSITPEVPFTITLNGETVSEGTFAYADTFDTYKEAIAGDTAANILEEGVRDDCNYYLYTVTSATGSEHNYIIRVTDSDTCILLGSLSGEEAAREVFDRLAFIKK